MNLIDLEVELRQEVGKINVKRIRKEGYVPAIIYGLKKECIPIKVKTTNLQKIYSQESGKNTLLNLVFNKGEKKLNEQVISYDITKNIFNHNYDHIDFMRIEKDVDTVAVAPIKLIGEAPGTRKGGILVQKLWELKIKCKPSQIPLTIDVSIDKLEIGQFITVKNIQELVDYKILNTENDSIVRITNSRLSIQESEDSNTEEDATTSKASS